jgi:hypothetical protein
MALLAHYGHLGMLEEGAALTIKNIHHQTVARLGPLNSNRAREVVHLSQINISDVVAI